MSYSKTKKKKILQVDKNVLVDTTPNNMMLFLIQFPFEIVSSLILPLANAHFIPAGNVIDI